MKHLFARRIACLVTGAVLLAATPAAAQGEPDGLARAVTLTLRETPLADALRAIASQGGFRLSYSSGVVPVDRRVSLSLRGVPAGEALRQALAGSGITWRTAAGQVVLVRGETPAAAQETGRVAGTVRAGGGGEPVAGARVTVAGTARAALTDVSGRYALDRVPAGAQSVTVERIGYRTKTVTGVEVRAGRTASLDLVLEGSTLVIAPITVTAERERGTARAMLVERQGAPAVVDVVGREQIDRSTDADAAEVVQRIPGAEIREGRYPVVRGLGDRYGEVTLNGVAIPSSDPYRKAVALDVLPSHLLESVLVSKAFTPDRPGDYTGGLVELRTRSVPRERVTRVSTGVAYNTETSLRRGLAFPGCSSGWTGMSDCWRFPSELNDGRDIDGFNFAHDPPLTDGRGPGEEEALAEALAASAPWAPVERDIPLNRSFSVTYGDVAGPVSFLAAGSWANAYNRRAGYADAVARERDGAPAYASDFRIREGTHDVTVGGSLAASLLLGTDHRLSFTTLYNRQNEERGIEREGFYASGDIDVRIPENRYVEHRLWSAQLNGQHLLGGATVDWRGAYSAVGRLEPGSRRVIYTTRTTRSTQETGYVGPVDGATWEFFSDRFSGEVLHQDLDEGVWTGGVDVTVPLRFWPGGASLKLGGATERSDRGVITRRIRFLPASGLSGLPGDVGTLDPNALFTPAHIGGADGQLTTDEPGNDRDSYDALSTVDAAYAMVDLQILPRLRLVTGVRVEDANQEVDAHRLFGPVDDAELQGTQGSTDVLPAAHLTWQPRSDMNVRGGVGRTVARPQFREIAPFSFQDFFLGYNTEGNPRLRRTVIDNADLRWEWFPSPSSVLSFGVFGKRFYLPIEPLVFGEQSGSVDLRYINTPRADTYGLEAEARVGLGGLSPILRPFSVNANYTALRTSVDSVAFRIRESVIVVPPSRRVIFGQTPYLLNLGLNYDHPRWGTLATLLFRASGDRLEIAPSAFSPALYEQGRSGLDAVVEQPLGRGLSVKASAERIVGSRVRFTQDFSGGEHVAPRVYDLGTTFSLSFTWDGGAR